MQKRSCLKAGMFGCLGLLLIVILVVGVTTLVAHRGIKRQRIEERALTPVAVQRAERALLAAGRVILDLADGEFEIMPALPGEGVSVEARYDQESYALADSFETLPDSRWAYRVRFRRTISGLQALMRAILGGDTETWVHVYLPPDVPIDLVILAAQGGLEAELGGLWITQAEIRFEKGGFSLSVDEPLREPMQRLSIRGRMGGFEAVRLGNASPRSLIVDCKMGGADVDLRGDWLQDCDVRLALSMGGMSVTVPREVDVQGLAGSSVRLRPANPEVSASPPMLYFSISQKMGEVDVSRR
jgi:hypothetical protein